MKHESFDNIAYSMMTSIPGRKRMMDKAQLTKIPLRCWFSLTGAEHKIRFTANSRQCAFIKNIQCSWAPFFFNVKKISLCWIEPHTFAVSNHKFATFNLLHGAFFKAPISLRLIEPYTFAISNQIFATFNLLNCFF